MHSELAAICEGILAAESKYPTETQEIESYRLPQRKFKGGLGATMGLRGQAWKCLGHWNRGRECQEQRNHHDGCYRADPTSAIQSDFATLA